MSKQHAIIVGVVKAGRSNHATIVFALYDLTRSAVSCQSNLFDSKRYAYTATRHQKLSRFTNSVETFGLVLLFMRAARFPAVDTLISACGKPGICLRVDPNDVRCHVSGSRQIGLLG